MGVTGGLGYRSGRGGRKGGGRRGRVERANGGRRVVEFKGHSFFLLKCMPACAPPTHTQSQTQLGFASLSNEGLRVAGTGFDVPGS